MATKTVFDIRRHDLMPDLVVRLLDGTTPVDLSTALSAQFHMRSLQTGVKVNAPAVIADQSAEGNLGYVSYAWATGDTDTVGMFEAEIQITWPGQKPQTFPVKRTFYVNVVEELA